jgi:CHAD domain
MRCIRCGWRPRRMRSALQAYGKIIDRLATRELTDELKWLAGVLGDDRDLEVLHARFTHAVAGLPDELVVGPVQARLTRYFAGRETDARTAVIAAQDSDGNATTATECPTRVSTMPWSMPREDGEHLNPPAPCRSQGGPGSVNPAHRADRTALVRSCETVLGTHRRRGS